MIKLFLKAPYTVFCGRRDTYGSILATRNTTWNITDFLLPWNSRDFTLFHVSKELLIIYGCNWKWYNTRRGNCVFISNFYTKKKTRIKMKINFSCDLSFFLPTWRFSQMEIKKYILQIYRKNNKSHLKCIFDFFLRA